MDFFHYLEAMRRVLINKYYTDTKKHRHRYSLPQQDTNIWVHIKF